METQERIDQLNERIGHLWPIRNKLQREIEAIDKEIMPLYNEKWKLETILVGVKKCPAFTPERAKKRQFKEEDLATIVANFKNYSPAKQKDILERLNKRVSEKGE